MRLSDGRFIPLRPRQKLVIDLLKLGPASATELGDASELAAGQVFAVLDELRTLGVVTADDPDIRTEYHQRWRLV